MTSELKILRNVAAFAHLSPQDLESIAGVCTHAAFAEADVLMRQGATEQHALIILDGAADVIVSLELGPITVATLTAGALVGEIGLFCDSPRTATVVAARACKVLVLTRAAMEDLAARSPGFGLTIMRLMASRLEQNVEAITYFKTMAQALRNDSFRIEVPASMAARDDEVGAFARAFDDMMKTVRAREAKLQEEVRELKVEIDVERKKHQVAAITETAEFKALTERAAAMRARRSNR